MDKIAEFVVSLFRDLKLPYKWGAIGVILTLIVLGVWGFERVTGQFYLSRLERKTTLLTELKELRDSGITQDPELNKIYQNLVKDLESFSVKQPIASTSGTGEIDFTNPVTLGKAISGGFPWILIFIIGIPIDIKKNKRITGTTIFIGIFILSIALLFAWIGMLIPTIVNPWVNYIGFPILQIFVLVYFSVKSAKPVTNSPNK
jgi:hypothetical protein